MRLCSVRMTNHHFTCIKHQSQIQYFCLENQSGKTEAVFFSLITIYFNSTQVYKVSVVFNVTWVRSKSGRDHWWRSCLQLPQYYFYIRQTTQQWAKRGINITKHLPSSATAYEKEVEATLPPLIGAQIKMISSKSLWNLLSANNHRKTCTPS